MVDLFIDLVALLLFFYIYRYMYIFHFSLFVSVYAYASLCDFVCITFAFTICPRVLSVWFVFYLFVFSLVFSAGTHWWISFWFGCSLLSFCLFFLYFLISLFSIIFFIFYFNYFILLFLSFFLLFLLSRVTDRVFMSRPGVRSVPLRWESQVQDIGPRETSQLHVISNGESSPRDLHVNAKNQLHSTTIKLQC